MTLAADRLCFSYTPARPVLREISLDFPPGSITAILGPNGAGKSTLLRLLLGVLKPGCGRAMLEGRDIAPFPPRERSRRLAYIPQRTGPAFGYSVREYVQMGRFWSGDHDPAPAEAALGRVGLLARADEPLADLSAGQQQRATLARALAQLSGEAPGSRFALADEPISAMDPRHAIEAMDIFRDLASRGVGVAIVLHDLALALRTADRAAILNGEGRLLASGPAAAVLTEDTLARVFGVCFERLASPQGPVLVPAGLAAAAPTVQ